MDIRSLSRSLSRVDDQVLLRGYATSLTRESVDTAVVLAYLGEIDARQLYLPAGYHSLHAYCVGHWHLDEGPAYTQIRAARAAREFPAVLEAVAQGRLHLTAVLLLAPRLTEANVAELVAAASHKSKTEIVELLAARFPQPDFPTRVQHLPASVASSGTALVEPCETKLALERVEMSASPGKLTPLSPERVALQVTLSRSAHDSLEYLRALLSHEIPSRELSQVLERTFALAIGQLEKRKFGAASRPRSRGRASSTGGGRYIPMAVRRAVWERDEGQCTFTGDTGHRCGARVRLEFDHVVPVALGGESSVSNLRLRCRAHNQYEAERVFGAELMQHKRRAAGEKRTDAAAARERAAAEEAHAKAVATEEQTRAVAAEEHAKAVAAENQARAAAAERAKDLDVVPWLRKLGYNAIEARAAAKHCESIPDAPLEQRIRFALSYFYPKGRTSGPAASMRMTA